MGKAKISCGVVEKLADIGFLKSGDIIKLQRHGAITGECATRARIRITRKIMLNGTRRRRRR